MRLLLFLCGPALLAPSLVAAQQEPDTRFDTRVANPAFVTRHPRVLIDEAHHNFHTMDGRYRPFADLIRHDGGVVEHGRERFTLENLKRADVLVISNALGREEMDDSAAGDPAFDADECAAVRTWVNSGSALLLMADHAPMGAAARALGEALGVDMRSGYTIDPVQGDHGSTSHVWYVPGRGLAADHPIVRGRGPGELVKSVHTFTGQSLAGPPAARRSSRFQTRPRT